MTDTLLPVIRNAARALIVRNGQILMLRKEGGGRGERFALPGGAQDPGETLEAALQRECEEEIGSPVAIRDLLFVADFFKQRDTTPPSTRHLVEFVFECGVSDDYVATCGHKPDRHQTDVVWMDPNGLAEVELQPRSLTTFLARHGSNGGRVYLGLID